MPTIKPHIRWMLRRDMPEVVAIENLVFDFPWALEDFVNVARQRNAIIMVAEHSERIVGFMAYELHKTSIRIMNFAVHPEFQGMGVGGAMMAKLLGKLSEQRRVRITTEVRERNLDAQLFFKRFGFTATTVLREYYDDSDEDAYLFVHRLRVESEVPA